MNASNPFVELLPSAPQPLTTDTESHAKLKRNLNKALDRQDTLLDGPMETVGERMVVAGVAAAVVKAALTTDKNALRARSDNVLYRLLLRAIFIRKQNQREISAEDLELLRSAPRADLEAALGKMIAEYDDTVW